MSPSDLSYKHYFDYMYQDIFRTVIVNFGATYKIQLLLDKTIGTVYFFFRDTNLVLLSLFVLTWACDSVNEILSPVENAALDTLRRRPEGVWTGQVAVIGRYLSEFSTPPTQWSAATFLYLSSRNNILW